MLKNYRVGFLIPIALLGLWGCHPRPLQGGVANADTCGFANVDRPPPLVEYNGEMRNKSGGGDEIIMYRGGNNRRDVDQNTGGVMIINRDKGMIYTFFSAPDERGQVQTYIWQVHLKSEVQNGYWEGQPNACRLGPCQVGGVSGVEWSHPAGNGHDETRACISPDGIVLQASRAGRTTLTFEKLVRYPVASAMFDPPADAKIVTKEEFKRIATEAAKRTHLSGASGG